MPVVLIRGAVGPGIKAGFIHHFGQDGGVELVPRVGDCVIYVGSLERYPAKMDKLKVFYGKVPQRMGWDTYSRINLEYVDQVVCTRR